MAETLPPRSEVPREFTWNADSLFPSDEAWEAEFQSITEYLPSLDRFRGRLGESPALLLEWLGTTEALMKRMGKVGLYAMMFSTVDTTDQQASARTSRARGLGARMSAATAFAAPEMLQIGMETLQRWMQEEARLAVYAHFFEEMETRRAHVRSPEVEELLGQVSEPFGTPRTVHSLLSDADLTFRPAEDSAGATHEVAQGTIHTLLGSPDHTLRKNAWESYADAYLGFKNTLATCLGGGVKQDAFRARARRYASSLEASLHAWHIPTEVFHGVIATFRSHLPVWKRYFEVLRKALGYDTLHLYDLTAPLTRESPKVPYSQSVEWICAGMQPLGDAYVQAMRRGLTEERWVDVYPNKGKNMGAFSSGMQGTYPFIFMSYHDDLFGLSTLAHELGHSMHSYLAWQTQPPVYAGCGSEVTSNFNQALTRAYLFQANSDPAFQIALIEEAMANFYRYFLIMPTLARFELEIHERIERGQALTAESLNALMADLFEEAFGGAVEADRDRLGIIWAQFPTHVYGNIFMFLYTIGIAGAHALAEGILEGKPGAVERYLDYQRGGSSVYELEGLQRAGVDLTTPEPVAQTFGVLERMVERLATLTGQS
ncbi:MAG TPA: oligoendopeptidase F [Chthonomonadaceae bacterium]|nr:oligoendopeptidase F [Chthonomonadaceae bacterium]